MSENLNKMMYLFSVVIMEWLYDSVITALSKYSVLP